MGFHINTYFKKKYFFKKNRFKNNFDFQKEKFKNKITKKIEFEKV